MQRRFPVARTVAVALTLVWAAATVWSDPSTASGFDFVAKDAGLDLPTWVGSIEKPHLLESGGGGVALFDYDGDGDLDIYLTNAWPTSATPSNYGYTTATSESAG